jgi:ATP-dependent Clp protease ATP-binding subunit ClpA
VENSGAGEFDEGYFRRQQFTDAALQAMRNAAAEAKTQQRSVLRTRDVLVALLKDADGDVVHLVGGLGVPPDRLRAAVKSLPSPVSEGIDEPEDAEDAEVVSDHITVFRLSAEVQRVVDIAVDEAHHMYSHSRFVGEVQLLLGIIRVESPDVGDLLHAAGITLERARIASGFLPNVSSR